ncbi:hypothetical protein BK138_19115 [Paenibacillus rhizosphaerae]|uniref:DUF2500 domain-containing protein n=1 Tax=Paenibacillus rhizosphaerae TaxID=297318 RepID=A0A1R1EMJ6_9BACL|nr:DUF2500 domain-containing protein [Paenibacillus rhizosphaerae]OMF53027.1 hypothetical protein BK138_19115 [Paenibacillus rhizosphaerae]
MVTPGPPPFGGGGFDFFDFMFRIFPFIFGIVFIIIVASFIMNGARYFKNARTPRSSVYARVISKRMDIRHHSGSHHDNGSGFVNSSGSSRTYYYITLEFDNGERKEYLDVKHLYGLVAEGDEGYAAVQGDWIVGFEREVGQTP